MQTHCDQTQTCTTESGGEKGGGEEGGTTSSDRKQGRGREAGKWKRGENGSGIKKN